jgi:hypothetical protein
MKTNAERLLHLLSEKGPVVVEPSPDRLIVYVHRHFGGRYVYGGAGQRMQIPTTCTDEEAIGLVLNHELEVFESHMATLWDSERVRLAAVRASMGDDETP